MCTPRCFIFEFIVNGNPKCTSFMLLLYSQLNSMGFLLIDTNAHNPRTVKTNVLVRKKGTNEKSERQ